MMKISRRGKNLGKRYLPDLSHFGKPGFTSQCPPMSLIAKVVFTHSSGHESTPQPLQSSFRDTEFTFQKGVRVHLKNCGRSSELSLVFLSWVCGTQAAARRTTLKNLELTKAGRNCGGGGRRETRGTVTVFALTAVFGDDHSIYQQNMISSSF